MLCLYIHIKKVKTTYNLEGKKYLLYRGGSIGGAGWALAPPTAQISIGGKGEGGEERGKKKRRERKGGDAGRRRREPP